MSPAGREQEMSQASLALHSLVAFGGMRGGQPISLKAYSGPMRNWDSSFLRMDFTAISHPGMTSSVCVGVCVCVCVYKALRD